jgi:hypothetical protein
MKMKRFNELEAKLQPAKYQTGKPCVCILEGGAMLVATYYKNQSCFVSELTGEQVEGVVLFNELPDDFFP